jgi:acyl-CoA thioesterase
MNPDQIVNQMFQQDGFSQWLGISVDQVDAGSSKLTMVIKDEMLNGFGVAHGGITYSLADSALAFASNTRGQHALSIETSISHTRAVRTGDLLTAVAKEEHLSSRLGIYSIEVTNQNEEVVALFKGTVFRKDDNWTAPTK